MTELDRWLSDPADAPTAHAAGDMRAVQYLADGIGSWTDPATGTLYVDLSTRHDDLSDALSVAAERGEIALWDTVDQVAIDTPQPAAV